MRRWYLVICMVAGLFLAGCQNNKNAEKQENYIYYVNVGGTDLLKQEYAGDMDGGEKAVKEMLQALVKPGEDVEGQSPVPTDVGMESFELKEGQVDLYFDSGYHKMDVVEELLLRSALIQSLTRMEDIDSVAFFVDGEALTDRDNNPYGYMRAEDFVQNTGSAINSYQKKDLMLYFTDEAGTVLVEETKNVRYNSNTSMEKVIVECIMKGPSEGGHYPTISPEAKLLGVSVKDEICYVNFDDGIQVTAYNLKPEIPIYSIVNSLVENGIASQVQISINGETAAKFRGSVSIEQPFTADWNLVETKEKEKK